MQLFIMDFLTNRQQYVRTSQEQSSIITTNTGAPQGCVLSAFLFVLYTNDLARNNNVKIIKYADDTVVVGLVENDNESKYRSRPTKPSAKLTRMFSLLLNAIIIFSIATHVSNPQIKTT